jgi:hypothetical protein
MTSVQLRKKLHQFIDRAEEKKLKAIYTMVEDDIEVESLLTKEQMAELDSRLEEYYKGTGKNFSLPKALKKVRGQGKK